MGSGPFSVYADAYPLQGAFERCFGKHLSPMKSTLSCTKLLISS
jgi:hypothetical protein